MTKALIAKLEALEGPDVDVFCGVFEAVHPQSKAQSPIKQERDDWFYLTKSFSDKIRAKAWESAAIMLVPEGYAWGMDARHCSAILTRLSAFEHEFAQHPAIALLICILKAEEAQQ